ncbi:unnamed protein product [Rotaria magnacalcarata]|uniref:Phytanoyl-CoA dioxygenase n=4 Tax=Rotaria magnacalcarata TaxID=392030 RepID=A0A814WWQ6_9BILA|nr:unnamed protein product [Rotaria magnacalcarata]
MLSQDQLHQYRQDGFLVIKELLTIDECQQLKTAANKLIDGWQPEEDYLWIFPNGGTRERSGARQMIDSSDKISFFIEKDAVDPQTGKLNREKHLSVSMIGHYLHMLEPNFKTIAFSDKIKAIARDLQYIKPAIRQSLYIFKQPLIGEKITSHRDASYVSNEPFKIDGIWIALEDATVENGCLWFIPGSHSTPTQRHYIRNPNEQEFNEGKLLINMGEDQFDENAFIPVEVKAGDAVLIDGQVAHKSEQNKSSYTRQICAFHIFESHNSIYKKENWLQLTEPFPFLYEE